MTEISLLNFYLTKSIPQNLLLTENDFERYAENRGLNIRQEYLEFLENQRLLFPLCRVKLPVEEEYCEDGGKRRKYAPLIDISHNLLKWHNDGLCEDPVKVEFRPWREYRDDHFETARALYHPLQFKNLRTIVLSVGYEALFRGCIQKERKDSIAKIVTRDLKFFPLLISIEDVYLPIVRSNFIGDWRQPNIGFDVWQSLRSKFDPNQALKKSGLIVDEIQKWRELIAAQTSFFDPLANWYLLVRHATYHKRGKLKGEALFAQDCYEIIEMLGLFLKDLTGEHQYGPDDLLDGRCGKWKKEWYGAEVDFANRDVLRKIAYEYGLDYDYKLLLFVEGDAEFHAIPIIAEAMGIYFAKLGIRLEKLGGYSEIVPKRIEMLLRYAKKENITAYIVIDNHENSKKYVDELVARKDLPVEKKAVLIWDIDFEEDNFSVDELIEAARRIATRSNVQIDIKPKMIEETRKHAHTKGIANILVALCEERNFNLSKADLGRELGLMVAERIKNGKLKTTKIENELIKIVESTRGRL